MRLSFRNLFIHLQTVPFLNLTQLILLSFFLLSFAPKVLSSVSVQLWLIIYLQDNLFAKCNFAESSEEVKHFKHYKLTDGNDTFFVVGKNLLKGKKNIPKVCENICQSK